MCGRQGLARKFSPRVLLMSSSHQYKKPTSIFFISWVFFRLLKRKKILKRENDKKKILVHEIKIFFNITWSSFMWIYWGGFVVYLKTEQENLLMWTISSSLAIQRTVLLQDSLQDTGTDEAREEGFATTFYFK